MDEEKRRRVAERFALDDLPCGRAQESPGTASGDGTRAPGPGQVPTGRRGASERLGEVLGR